MRGVVVVEHWSVGHAGPRAPTTGFLPVPTPTSVLGAPDTVEFDRPSSARVYDYLLGGVAHGAVDRRFAETLLATEPGVRAVAQGNRAFLRRAVRFLLDAGIDQFIDLGSGVPTMGNVHEVVARSGTRASVAYVERDGVAAMSGRRLLADDPRTVYVEADIRDVDRVLSHPELQRDVDLSRPVGLLAFSVLQQVPDADDPAGLVEDYLARLAPGSALALSHLTADHPGVAMNALTALMCSYPRSAPRARSRAEVAPMLRGVRLVEPGLVYAAQWRPDPARNPAFVDPCGHLGAVGFLP